jgi:hypothetical protein
LITSLMGNNPNQTMPQTFPNKYLWVSTPKNNCSGDNNINGYVPKTNLNKPPSMPLHSPSRSVTLRHATSRSVTRFRQMTQFLKVKSRLFLKNHEKSRWITLRHATSRYVMFSTWSITGPHGMPTPQTLLYYHRITTICELGIWWKPAWMSVT